MSLPYGLSISGDDIETWANRIEAAGALPQVIRRLILATTSTDTPSFRADGGTRYPGWDGFVVSDRGGRFLPAGPSFWELSATRGTGGKLDRDYTKRSRESDHLIPRSSATYVAVTARRSVEKERWANKMRGKGEWLDVRCLDADDLATWLETAPAVAAWFAAVHLNRPVSDLSSVADYLEEWTRSTVPPLPAHVHLLGKERVSAAAAVREWLTGAPASFVVRGETLDLARQFVASTLMSFPEEDGVHARSLLTRSEAAHRWALRQPASARLIILPAFDAARVAGALHHVAHALGPSSPGRPHVTVGAVPYRLMDPELAAAGFDHPDRIARESRGSLAALPRLCGASSAVGPEWTREPSPAAIALLLVGRWNPTTEGDREAVAALAHMLPDDLDALCADLSQRPETPIRLHHGRSGASSWCWTSPADAWESLAPRISGSVLRDFRELAVAVLGEQDPVYSMPHEQRFYAGIHGKVRRHSSELREGIAETLCRLSMSDSVLASVPGGGAGSAFAAGIVRELLREGCTAWASGSELLSELAEAAPGEFLDAVERSLSHGPNGVTKLFAEECRSTSPHSALLWALERLAWAPERMSRVARVLARLAEADPGGSLANRPSASLHRLIHPFCPATNAPLDERLSVLREIHRRQPDFAWKFTLGLAESFSGGFAFPAAKPRYLRELCEDRTVTNSELMRHAEVVRELLLGAAGHKADRWVELLAARSMPWEFRIAFLNEANKLALAGELGDERHVLWNALREPLHFAYMNDADDAAEELELLLRLYGRLTPTDAVVRFAWLFGPHAHLPERAAGWPEEQERLEVLRNEALDSLLRNRDGLGCLRALAATVESPLALGVALGKSQFVDELEAVLLEDANPAWRRIRPAYFAVLALNRERDWIRAYLTRLASTGRLDEATESALLLPRKPTTWDVIEEIGDESREAYWNNGGFNYPHGKEDAERTVRELARVGAYAKAIAVAGAFAGDVCPSTIARILAAGASCAAVVAQAGGMRGHHVEQLFERLYAEDSAFDDDELVKLELAYLGWLTRPSARTRSMRLFRALAEQPELFAQLIRMLYRRRVEDAGSDDGADEGVAATDDASIELRQANAELAYHVLSNWKAYPGQGTEPRDRERTLLEWSRRALELTASDGRRAVGQIEVARVLARVPAAPDGIWPCEAARFLVDELGPDFGDHLAMAKLNLRGVVSKELYEGGKQEDEIAGGYRDGAVKLRQDPCWVATAALLDKMAERYEREAAEEDARARSEKLEAGQD